MPHTTVLISTVAAALGVAFVLGLLAARLQLPPIVGYLAAGVVVGPFTPGYVADAGLAPQLAEVGVILLMFGVGLHFSLGDLARVRRVIPASLAAEIHYPGTVFFEAINVSEGRGTDRPFEQIGAPWLRNQEVVARMNAMRLPGIRFEALDVPVAAGARKYPGETIKGVRFVVTDRETYRPIRASLLMIDVIRRLHPAEFQWRGANQREPTMLTIERHGGTARLREAIEAGTLPQLLQAWDADAERFRAIRAPYLLYGAPAVLLQ